MLLIKLNDKMFLRLLKAFKQYQNYPYFINYPKNFILNQKEFLNYKQLILILIRFYFINFTIIIN